MPSTWRALALIARTLDARPGLRVRRARRTMSEAELEATRDVLRRVPAAIERWSEGNVEFARFDIEVVDEPIRRLVASGPGRFWVAPSAMVDAIHRFAPIGRYDSILVVHPTDGSFGLCGWGCTVGPSAAANGAGYSAIISDHWAGYPGRLHPEEGFVHEWLHQVEAIYRRLGLDERSLPSLHDVDGRTSARPAEVEPNGETYPAFERRTGSWQPWYRDYLTGTIGLRAGERGPLGLTAERWARRTAQD